MNIADLINTMTRKHIAEDKICEIVNMLHAIHRTTNGAEERHYHLKKHLKI